jgi:hypothetical protein
MQIVYGFIYFFTILMTCSIAALSVFLIPKARALLVKLRKNYQDILKSDVFWYGMLLTFAVIGLVFIESVYTYSILSAHFSKSTLFVILESTRIMTELGSLDNIDLVIPKTHNREGYLVALKEYREYYLAERNIMLAVSACFTFFVFQRLLYNIRKYAELEH